MVVFEVREISLSYYACPANAALLFLLILWFLSISRQFAEFRGKRRWDSHSLLDYSGRTTITRMKIGRTTIGRRQLLATKIGRMLNWSDM